MDHPSDDTIRGGIRAASSMAYEVEDKRWYVIPGYHKVRTAGFFWSQNGMMGTFALVNGQDYEVYMPSLVEKNNKFRLVRATPIRDIIALYYFLKRKLLGNDSTEGEKMSIEQSLSALKRYYIAEYFDGEDEWPTLYEDYERGELVWADDADKILSGAVLQRYGGWGGKDDDGELYLYDDVVESLRMRNEL